MKNFDHIITQLPYSEPFLFVDEISEISEDYITGTYFFSPESEFYKGHFKNYPITPGVILTECMAQIGLVAFGIYLIEMNKEFEVEKSKVALTTSEMEFIKPVFPSEKVTVKAVKKYFRFGKLKSAVKMFNERNELVCQGILSGMIVQHEKA